MVEVICWIAAIFTTMLGMASLALSLPNHWRQVTGIETSLPSPSQQNALRIFGYSTLVVSFVLCLLADHPTMAVLVWVMLLSLAGKGIASILTWRQHWLKPLLWLFNRTELNSQR
ncbi:DUF3325 domain-containing protein [Methylophaga sp.]|uniref:DUF3325 domain-containing protein n=1 Tax=Methylophaga sp. TaxID=2024840 RepID=UPI002726ACCD|nr:DUF3325 domain-containing protein [Methylophaga sp.]MDO8826208.1 DUF3325 domain-containing protein [Methylophaga sp.]